MKNIKGENVNELFFNACSEVHNRPQFKFLLNKRILNECINVSLLLKNPMHRICTYPQKSLSLKQVAGEIAFMFSNSNKLKDIKYYTAYWDHKTDDGKTINSCIGKRIFKDINRHKLTQFDYAYKLLNKRLYSNEATIVLYDKHSADLNTRDNPTIMNMQFIIRGYKLYLIVTSKKEDLWHRFLFNTILFTIIQEKMLLLLNKKYHDLKMGYFIYNIGSLYLYADDKFKLDNLLTNKIKDPDYLIKQLPPITSTTFDELPLFLRYEEEHRKNTTIDIKKLQNIKDPFLIKIISYLNENK